MSTGLADIVKSLGGSREGVLPSARVFPRVDVDQIAAELRLAAKGQSDGQANLPSPTSSSEPAAESDIRAEIDQRAARALEDYRVQLDLYNGRIKRGIIVAELRTSIEAAGERALSDFRIQATDDLSHLDPFVRELRARQKEFDDFRQAHQLKRLPRPVTGSTVRWMVILLLVLLESLLNGLFFAEGSVTGLIGGVSQAVVLSLFNVGLGVSYARVGIPYFHHRNWTLNVWAIIATASYLVVTVALNLAIGHYRDLFVQNEGAVSLPTLTTRLTSETFNLADTRSLILVVLGMTFSALAVIDALGLDDLYPGYGKVGRLKDDAIATYADHRTRCLTDLEARRDKAIGEMSEIIEDVKAKEHDVQLALSGRTRLHQEYVSYLDHLSHCHVRLVQRYREANLRARSAPAPVAFNDPSVPPPSVQPPPPLVEVAVDRDSMAHVVERMEYFIKAISQEYDSQAARYKPVNQLVDSALRDA